MRISTIATAAVLAIGFAAPALADASMAGKWSWEGFTIECKEGGANGMSCIVVDGPKNKGMEMIKSKLEKKGNDFVGQVAHPASGEVYNSKMNMSNADTWNMDGCTAANVCAKGTFTRVK